MPRDRKRIREFIEGLLILEPYDEGGYGLQAEHDEIFCAVKKEPTAEEKVKLEELGWRINDGDPCLWSKFT